MSEAFLHPDPAGPEAYPEEMSAVRHHIPESVLIAYASGSLPHAFSLVVATHVSMCAACRSSLQAHQAVGGALLDQAQQGALSSDLKARVLSRLDEAGPAPGPRYTRSSVYPAPVMEALGGLPPRWQRLGMGVRQMILSRDQDATARLLYIPGGQCVPDHGHNGLELTLVLQGAFRDETGRYGVGDVEVADADLEHQPVAEMGQPSICLAATDAKLRFHAFMPRLLQPLFKI